MITTVASLDCSQEFYACVECCHDRIQRLPGTPTTSFDRAAFSWLDKTPVEKFLLEPPHAGGKYWESMHNPVAGELGITTQQELDDFVENSLPMFKAVIKYPKGKKGRTHSSILCAIGATRTFFATRRSYFPRTRRSLTRDVAF